MPPPSPPLPANCRKAIGRSRRSLHNYFERRRPELPALADLFTSKPVPCH